MKKRNIILATVTAVLIGSGFVYAGSKAYQSDKWGHHGPMGHGIERMVDHLDCHLKLNDAQEAELQQILDSNRDMFTGAWAFKQTMTQKMTNLSPDSPSYQSEVTAIAEQLSQEVKQKTLQSAELIKQISAILSEEQKSEVRRMIQHRMQRHAEHDQG